MLYSTLPGDLKETTWKLSVKTEFRLKMSQERKETIITLFSASTVHDKLFYLFKQGMQKI